MFQFIKNLFKRKELWVFASYFVKDKDNFALGHLSKPYKEIYNKGDMIADIKNYIESMEDNKKSSAVILYYNTWLQ